MQPHERYAQKQAANQLAIVLALRHYCAGKISIYTLYDVLELHADWEQRNAATLFLLREGFVS